MIRVLLLGVAAGAAFATANAADLPKKYEFPTAPQLSDASAYSWAGCYVGAQIGGGWTRDTTGVVSGVGGARLATGSINGSGVKGGAYVGCNHQTEAGLVLGLEADLDASSITGRSAVVGIAPAPGNPPNPGGQYSSSEKVNWQGSLRARGGYALGNALLYVTGGWAFANVRTNYFGTATGAPQASVTSTSPYSGWTLGAGVDYAVASNVIARVEYRYADFGHASDSIGGAGPYFWNTTTASHALTEHVVRLGVSVKFGADAPIVAKN